MTAKRAIQFEKQRARFYRSSKAIARRALKQYTKDFEKSIEGAQTVHELVQAARKDIRTENIENALQQIYANTGKYFGKKAYDELKPKQKAEIPIGERIEEDYWFAWANKIIRGQLGKRITWITQTTKDVFMSTVDRISMLGLNEGWGIDKISREIMKDLNITERYRAERIARTEVISASNASTAAGANATGLSLDKEWISYLDDKTRDTHRDINGKTVDQYEDFILSNGNTLEYPGDPQGEAEDVINCRCTIGYKAKEGGEYSWGREL
jgi:hypothetical protein